MARHFPYFLDLIGKLAQKISEASYYWADPQYDPGDFRLRKLEREIWDLEPRIGRLWYELVVRIGKSDIDEPWITERKKMLDFLSRYYPPKFIYFYDFLDLDTYELKDFELKQFLIKEDREKMWELEEIDECTRYFIDPRSPVDYLGLIYEFKGEVETFTDESVIAESKKFLDTLLKVHKGFKRP